MTKLDGAVTGNDLFQRLANDPGLPLEAATLDDILTRAALLTGRAGEQVDAYADAVEEWLQRVPSARDVAAGPIL